MYANDCLYDEINLTASYGDLNTTLRIKDIVRVYDLFIPKTMWFHGLWLPIWGACDDSLRQNEGELAPEMRPNGGQ